MAKCGWRLAVLRGVAVAGEGQRHVFVVPRRAPGRGPLIKGGVTLGGAVSFGVWEAGAGGVGSGGRGSSGAFCAPQAKKFSRHQALS